jgi:hypothetical protein
MKKITIRKVSKDKIRNKGVGDYFKKKDGIEIRVADLGSPDDELGIAIHELVESTLAEKRGIKFKDITKFDKKHEDEDKEPGEMKDAPYKKEHLFSNAIEAAFLKELRRKIKKQNK